MHRNRRDAFALAPGAVGILGLLLSLAVAAPAAADRDAGDPAGGLQYSRDAGTVLIRFHELLGELGEGDRGPSIAIHGDGTARVHYPAFMRRAGDYTTHLGAAELDRLVRVIARSGLLGFDAAAARRARADASAAQATDPHGRPTRHVVFDESTTVIELDLGGLRRTIRWRGLRADARRHPGIAALRHLADVQGELLTLMERPDLTRVEP